MSHSSSATARRSALAELVPFLRRLDWPAERERRLRGLISFTRLRSPCYRDLLGSVNLESFTEADLPRLPPMSEAEPIHRFDEIVTDPRIPLDVVNEHIENLRSDTYLFGRFRALPTGESSRIREVFVYDWGDWTTFAAMANRWPVRAALAERHADPGTYVSVYADRATHISDTLQDVFTPPAGERGHRLPVTLPVETLVAELNRLQPTELSSYQSTVSVLTAEAIAGSLVIRPARVSTVGELLSEASRELVREAWGIEVTDTWGCTVSVYAFTYTTAQGMHLPEDLATVEPVDASVEPVALGQPASKIYVTNLYNMAQPLIRCEITDSMTVSDEPCPCGSAQRPAFDLRSRLDDVFAHEGGPTLRSLIVLFDALEIDRHVIDFQVHQAPRRADALVVSDGLVDLGAIDAELGRSLDAA